VMVRRRGRPYASLCPPARRRRLRLSSMDQTLC